MVQLVQNPHSVEKEKYKNIKNKKKEKPDEKK